MPSLRTVAATTALLLGALAFAPTTSPSQAVAGSPRLSDAQVAALTPTQPMKGRSWIEGVVEDQLGHPVGNVEVEATSADDEGSSITYEQPGIAGSTGFFRIYDLTPGTYTLRFTSAAPKIKPATTTVTVGKREIGQADMTVTRVPVVTPTKTSAALQHKTVKTSQKGVVDVVVTTTATTKPVGTVEIREGRSLVGSGKLKTGSKGKITIVLEKLGKGSHVLKATFTGPSTLKTSSSGTFTLVVKKPRH
jgi:hypothetical protein